MKVSCIFTFQTLQPDTSEDGLQPNKYRIVTLRMNLLRCFFTFNLFLCDVNDFYEEELL